MPAPIKLRRTAQNRAGAARFFFALPGVDRFLTTFAGIFGPNLVQTGRAGQGGLYAARTGLRRCPPGGGALQACIQVSASAVRRARKPPSSNAPGNPQKGGEPQAQTEGKFGMPARRRFWTPARDKRCGGAPKASARPCAQAILFPAGTPRGAICGANMVYCTGANADFSDGTELR